MAFDSDGQDSHLPYNGRHRKAPLGVRAALRLGRRRAAAPASPPTADVQAMHPGQERRRLAPGG